MTDLIDEDVPESQGSATCGGSVYSYYQVQSCDACWLCSAAAAASPAGRCL